MTKPIEPTYGRGAYSAGLGLFGRPSRLMAPEGDTGSGGTGGAGGATGEGAGGTGGQSGDSGGGERKFTEADVNRIVTDRLARAARKGGDSGRQQQAASDGTEAKQTSKADTPDTAMLLADFQDNVDALSEQLGVKVPAEFKKRIRSLYVSERPAEPDAWLKGWFDAAGLTKTADKAGSGNSQQNNNQGQQTKIDDDKAKQQTGNGTVINSDKGGAGGGTVDFEAKLNERPLDLTALEIERLQEKHGEEKANAMIRDRVNAALRKIKLVADPRKLRPQQ